MHSCTDKPAAADATTRGRDILGAVVGLLGLALLALLNPASAVTARRPAPNSAIAARLNSPAAALRPAPAAASAVEFTLWAQSRLGPLKLVVESRSEGAP